MSLKLVNILKLSMILYMVLTPFYFWSSGLPQFADLLIILIILLSLLISNMTIPLPKTMVVLLILFVGYVILINSLWTVSLNDYSFLRNSIYYLFNSIVLVFFIFIISSRIFSVNELYLILYKGVCLSLWIQFLLVIVTGGITSTRTMLFFNNPNQLGYYALLSLAILIIVQRVIHYNSFIFFSSIFIGLFLIFISASKGALLSAVVLLAIFLILSKGSKWFTIFKVVGGSIGVFLFYSLITNQSYIYGHLDVLDSIISRINNASNHSDNFLAGRGYERILDYPQYLILGAGEGGVDRFNTQIELHSTLGNILFSYGLLGLILFGGILAYVIWGNKLIYAYPVICILIYGLTHNGIRNTWFWIVIALVFLLPYAKFKENKIIEPPFTK